MIYNMMLSFKNTKILYVLISSGITSLPTFITQDGPQPLTSLVMPLTSWTDSLTRYKTDSMCSITGTKTFISGDQKVS